MSLRAWRMLAAWVVMAGLASSCSSSGSSGMSLTPTNTVRLVQNPWDASRLDVAIAGSILTQQMGMNVETVELDEYSMWSDFASGTQDACLEVWPSGHGADIQNYVDTGTVGDLGPLGPVGKISWYVPTYLLVANPQLATWQAYLDPANTAAFATLQTGSKGQFLTGDPTWTSYDQDIITNLGLNLEIVRTGSEDTELTELDQVYQQRGALLLYLWTPHAALEKYDLTPVALPPYTPECYAKIPTHGVDCDYPPDPLFKIVWPGLQTTNPRAYQFLESFTLTTLDQITLLNRVDNEDVTIQQAASDWISDHQSVWQAWIP
jgi:glycine betaine/proline transport system substrate-binding protein